MRFFEDGFDYQKYIEDRLLEVGNLSERKELKEVMGRTLLPFYEQAEEAYRELEQRLFACDQKREDAYRIAIGIERRDRIDLADKSLVPMCMEDMHEHPFDIARFRECQEAGLGCYAYTVFMNADYLKIKSMDGDGRRFCGTVKTTYGEEYKARFQVKKCRKYIDMLGKLYGEFINNGIPWRTVCAPYLYKLYDVYIIGTDCPDEEEIDTIHVDFEEFADNVCYQYVPLWNISSVEVMTSSYPKFVLDKIHYLHTIFATKLDSKKDYLISNQVRLWDVSRQNGELRIQCDEKEPVNWTLREFFYEKSMMEPGLPVFDNKGNTGRESIHTVAEARHYVLRLGYGEYLRLDDIRLDDGSLREETYGMDAFITEEIRQRDDRRKLYFVFTASDGRNVLNRDIMSYLVSCMQLIYPEYQCIGSIK